METKDLKVREFMAKTLGMMAALEASNNDYYRPRRTPLSNGCCGRTMKQCSKHEWKCSMCGKVKDLRKENLRKAGK